MNIRPSIAATFFAFLPIIAGGQETVAEFTPEESEKLDWKIIN